MPTDVLILIGNGLGNLIEQTPLAIAAASTFGEVDVWTPRTGAEIASVLRDMPGARRLYTREERPDKTYEWAYASWLVREGLQSVQARKARVSRFPGPRNRRSEADRVMDMLRRDGHTGDAPAPYCGWDRPRAGLLQRGAPTIGLVCGSSPGEWTLKRYPRMAAAVEGLLARFPEAAFNLVGCATDDAVEHPRVNDLRGAESLRGTIGLLRACDLVIASDSGLAHASAALGVPTLVLFGPTQAAKNRPAGAAALSLKLACQPCQYRSPRIGLDPATFAPCAHACMRDLAPELVAAAAVSKITGISLLTPGRHVRYIS